MKYFLVLLLCSLGGILSGFFAGRVSHQIALGSVPSSPAVLHPGDSLAQSVLGGPVQRSISVTATTPAKIPPLPNSARISFEILTSTALGATTGNIHHRWEGSYQRQVDGVFVLSLDWCDGAVVQPAQQITWKPGQSLQGTVNPEIGAIVLTGLGQWISMEEARADPTRISCKTKDSVLSVPNDRVVEGLYHAANHTGCDEVIWQESNQSWQHRILTCNANLLHAMNLRVYLIPNHEKTQ